MPDEDKTFSGSFVLDLRIWWRHVHTLYTRGKTWQVESVEHIEQYIKFVETSHYLKRRGRKAFVDSLFLLS